MFSSVTFGQYMPGHSSLHRMDPRTKVGAVLAGAFVAILAVNWQGFVLTAAYVLAGALLSGFRPAVFFMGLRSFWFILALTFILQVLLTPGEPFFAVGGLGISEEGLVAGWQVFFRLVALITIASLLTLTTSPMNLTAGLEALFAPLKKVGLPAHEIAMMMSIALRFVPTLFEEAQTIIKAQQSRGAGTGGLLARIKGLLPLLVPLCAGAIRRAEELAVAMEARCYRPGAYRSRLSKLAFGPLDYGVLALSAASLAVAYLLKNC